MSKAPSVTDEQKKKLNNYVKEQEKAKESVWKKVWKGMLKIVRDIALRIIEDAIAGFLEDHGLSTDDLRDKWDEFKKWLGGGKWPW